jgi:hypothetical protein
MLLRTRLRALAADRQLSRLALLRVESALDAIERELGIVEASMVQGDLELAQKISVPGDDAVYIVIGEWSDGTVDIVREQGIFTGDCLVGWRPGQSVESYKTELQNEPIAEIVPDVARNTRPLLVSKKPARGHRDHAP